MQGRQMLCTSATVRNYCICCELTRKIRCVPNNLQKQPPYEEEVIWIPESGKFLLAESEIQENSVLVKSGIQLKEIGIPLTTGIQNPRSTDIYWNPESKTVVDSLSWGKNRHNSTPHPTPPLTVDRTLKRLVQDRWVVDTKLNQEIK